MLAEEFFPKGMANEMKGVRPDIREDFVGKIGGVYVENVAADDVVCGDSNGS